MKAQILISSLAVLFLVLTLPSLQFQDKFDKYQFHKSNHEESITINGEITEAILKTTNGCGIGNYLIPLTGDTTLGIPPMIASIHSSHDSITINSIVPGTEIKGVAFHREYYTNNTSIASSNDPYVIISDVGMFSYDFPGDYNPYSGELTQTNSLDIPGITKVATQITFEKNSPIVLLTNELLNEYRISFYSYSPGDSLVMLTAINSVDSSILQTPVYLKSGARATYNEFQSEKRFTFQPISDSPNSDLNKQILILDPINLLVDTFTLNREVDYFKKPLEAYAGFGSFSLNWIAASWQTDQDSVYFGDSSPQSFNLSTNSNPNYINATFGCWVGINGNELEKIKFNFFPNPASTSVIVHLKGLTKGRIYDLDIIDNNGKLHFTTKLEAYQDIYIPLQDLSKGIYYFKLDTGKNLITKKLILQ